MIVNLTPHPITLIREDGTTVTVYPCGVVVRAQEQREVIGHVEGFPVYRVHYGEPEGLPDELDEKAVYIVSSLALQAIKQHRPEIAHRFYVVSDPVRDEEGKIIGARALAQ